MAKLLSQSRSCKFRLTYLIMLHSMVRGVAKTRLPGSQMTCASVASGQHQFIYTGVLRTSVYDNVGDIIIEKGERDRVFLRRLELNS